MQGSVVDFRALAAHEDVHQPSLALIKTGASEPCGIQGKENKHSLSQLLDV